MKKIIFTLLASMMMLIQCTRPSPTETDHHDHEEEITLQLTEYSSHYELFAETELWVAGEACSILAHLTRLPDFKPVPENPLTITLTVGGQTVKAEAVKPVRSGIYPFTLTPPASGKGTLVFTSPDGEILAAVNLDVFKTEEEAHEHHESSPASPQGVVFTKESSWKVDFATSRPAKGTFGNQIKTFARIQSAQGDEVIITAKAGGIVHFSGEDVLPGSRVSAAKAIFSISGGGLVDNNMAVRFTEARNHLQQTGSEFKRARELAKDRIVSEKELIRIKNEFENAKAVYDNLSRHFNADSQQVTSPISGYIKQVFVSNGQYVNPGEAIVAVSQNLRLLLQADVRQKFAPILGTLTSATLRTLHDNRVYTLEELNGRILAYGQSAGNDDFLIPVTLQIDNIGGLLPGGFAELTLKSPPRGEALSIPDTAILEDQGIHFVFVQITPESFEKRSVQIGESDGLQTEILSGLAETDRLVSRGAIWVKLAQASGALDAHAGHVH